MTICKESECKIVARGRGLCAKHYASAKRLGEFGGTQCHTQGCDGPSYTLGLCSRHYQLKRMRAKGVTPRVRPASPAWHENSKGYIIRKWILDGGKVWQEFQHRAFMEEHLGRKLMDKENVHHINGVRNDNRLENLELWSTKQPYGQRVADKTAWAKEWLAQYDPDSLAA